jgi:hypothetical protein
MLEKAKLVASLLTEVKAPAKAAAHSAVTAMVRRRPRRETLTRPADSIGPKMPTVEEME